MKKINWIPIILLFGIGWSILSCSGQPIFGTGNNTNPPNSRTDVPRTSAQAPEGTSDSNLEIPLQILNFTANEKGIDEVTSLAWLQNENLVLAGSNIVAITHLPAPGVVQQTAPEFNSQSLSENPFFLTAVPSINVLAWVNGQQEINFWDPLKNVQARSVIKSELPVTGLSIHPKGDVIAFARYLGELSLVNISSGREIAHWQPPAWLSNLSYSPDGSFIAGVDQSNFIAYIFSGNGSIIKQIQWNQSISPTLYGAFFSPDWTKIAWVARSEVQIMDTETGAAQSLLSHEDSITTFVWSSDSTKIATAAVVSSGIENQSMVYVWNLQEMSAPKRYPQTDPVQSLTFSPDGDKLAVLDNTGKVKLYEIAR